MLKTTELTHLLIKEHLKFGDTCIDATCGMGNDTLFLRSLVGDQGVVHAYDIQLDAINETKKLLKDYTNIIYHHESHELINISNAKVILFNLGFLPNHNKTIKTNKESTLNAIKNILNIYINNQDMILFINCYPGHLEGLEESNCLINFSKNLDSKKYLTTIYQPLNQKNAPFLITIKQKTPLKLL